MRTSTKGLAFPLAGVSRRGPHRQDNRAPFTAPWAVNVRTVGPSELRRRGGSRPGLAKFCPTRLGDDVSALIPVTYYDTAGVRRHDLVYVADGDLGYVRDGVAVTTTAELEGPDGVDILDDNDATIDFSAAVSAGALQGTVRSGWVYFADSVLRRYNPATGVVEAVVATAGIVPAGQPLIALYRDRILLAGSSQAYFASRVSDPGDWDYGAAMEDPGAAVAGQLSDAGLMGGVLTAMIPVHDRALVLATRNTLWVIRGDPVGGRLENVSDELGIVAPGAWAESPDGLLCFLSNDGVYLWGAGSGEPPTRFSAERVPDELREIDTDAVTVSMCYDSRWRGFHLFLTPVDGVTVGTHWWIDVDNRAFWPQRFPVGHQPLDAAALADDGLGGVVLAGADGYLRYFLDGQADDDGLELGSHVLLGPVHLGADNVRDGLLAEIHGSMEGLSEDNSVTWRAVTGRSAAEAVEAALADLDDVLDGLASSRASAAGAWLEEGRARVQRPRCRGAWVVVWLSSAGAWSYEAIDLVARQLGRHR